MTERFWSTPIATPRPTAVYTYWVTGRGEFPLDMLRYDQAWPARDAEGLCGTGRRSVLLASYREPTVERWLSFIWSPSAEHP